MNNTPDKINILDLISKLDSFFARNDLQGAEGFLESSLLEARRLGDWSAEVSILSEQMGFFRRNNKKEEGLRAVDEGIALIYAHSLQTTVSGGTILLNAATTLKAFGEKERSMEVFLVAKATLEAKLSPADYRLAGLYNNMALTLVDLSQYGEAEEYYFKALSILEKTDMGQNERAVTYCNMAYMYYNQNPEDDRINEVMEKAEALLEDESVTRDGYYAFTISKCLSAFEFFGYFLFAERLKKRAEEIYEGN